MGKEGEREGGGGERERERGRGSGREIGRGEIKGSKLHKCIVYSTVETQKNENRVGLQEALV